LEKRAVSKDALYSYINAYNDDYSVFVNILVKDCQNKFEKNMRSASSRKKAELKGQDISGIRYFLEYTVETLNLLELSIPATIYELIGQINGGNYDEVLNVYKEQAKKENEAKLARKKEYEAKQAALLIQALDSWQVYKTELSWQERQALRDSKKIYMRVSGDNIETSKGATFPIDHAIKAFKIVRLCKEREKTMLRETEGHTYHLGHFTIDTIEANGNVKAGCHYVEYDQILKCAIELKIYP